MATTYDFTSSDTQGTRGLIQPVLDPGVITPIKNRIDFSQQTLDAGDGDIAQCINIPSETYVLDCFVSVATAETANATFDLGYGGDAGYFGKNLNLDSTGVVPTLLSGSDTWDAESIDDGNEEAKEVTVAGASLGDRVYAVPSIDVTDLIVSATVTDEDTVTVILANNTGAAINLASMNIAVFVDKGNLRGNPLYFSSSDTIDITAKTTNGDVDFDGAIVDVIALCVRWVWE
jgi:hypothetical protein